MACSSLGLLTEAPEMSLAFVSVPSEHSQHHGQRTLQRSAKARHTFASYLQNQCLSVMTLSPFSDCICPHCPIAHSAPATPACPSLSQDGLSCCRHVSLAVFTAGAALILTAFRSLLLHHVLTCRPPLLPSLLRTPYHSSIILRGVVYNHLSTLAGELALGSNTIMCLPNWMVGECVDMLLNEWTHFWG